MSEKRGDTYETRGTKQDDVRMSNILAAKGVLETIRTSLGPRGMDKMITGSRGDVLVTNDGATIMKQLEARHPAVRILVETSKAQDIEAGDGTTSVVVLACSFLEKCLPLFKMGIHPTKVSEAFQKAETLAQKVVDDISVPLSLDDRETLIKLASTSLSSKVVSPYSAELAPLAVDAVLNIVDSNMQDNVDLRNIQIVEKEGGSLEQTHIVNGVVFPKKPTGPTAAIRKIANAKVGIAQFCLSPPKTNMDSSVVVSDYASMDRILREEKQYILNLVKQIKKSGCNVLIIQKSVLRDSISELALHFLAKLKIMVIADVDAKEINFISKTTGAQPVARIESFTADKLGHAKLAEVRSGMTYITDCETSTAKTCTVICRGSNELVLAEASRSLHDAFCVVRALVKRPTLVPGGAAVETEVCRRLNEESRRTDDGALAYCLRAYADAFEIIPTTLAENAGLPPIKSVNELRSRHAVEDEESKFYGVDIKNGEITNMVELGVVQPSLVSSSAIALATETTRTILKIDDLVLCW